MMTPEIWREVRREMFSGCDDCDRLGWLASDDEIRRCALCHTLESDTAAVRAASGFVGELAAGGFVEAGPVGPGQIRITGWEFRAIRRAASILARMVAP